MKTKLILGVNLLAAVAAAQQNAGPAAQAAQETSGITRTVALKADLASSVLKTLKQRYSYALGVDFANQLKMGSVDLDSEQFTAGLNAVLSGDMPLLTSEAVRNAIVELQSELKRKKLNPTVLPPDVALKAGQEFLKNNKGKEGVVTLASGLQYRVLKAGDGQKPEDDDDVTVHYRGTMLDGAEFDSSYTRGFPLTMRLKDMIPGWKEGIKLMAVGSKFQLFVPSSLAYGEKGSLPRIGPNNMLIFEVDLLATRKQ